MTKRILEINKAESEHQLAEVLLEIEALEKKKILINANLDAINKVLVIPDNEVEYLYGCKAEEFIGLLHPEALVYKLRKSKELHKALYEANLTDFEYEVRLFKVTKAINHTEKRIGELL